MATFPSLTLPRSLRLPPPPRCSRKYSSVLTKSPNPKSQIPNQKKKRRIFHPALVLDRSPSLLSTASLGLVASPRVHAPPTPNSFPLFPKSSRRRGARRLGFLGPRFNHSPNLTAGVATTDRRGTLRLSRVSACYSRQPAAAIVSGPG